MLWGHRQGTEEHSRKRKQHVQGLRGNNTEQLKKKNCLAGADSKSLVSRSAASQNLWTFGCVITLGK